MDEHSTPPSSPPPAVSSNPDPTQYWCYQCYKRVPIETRPDQNDIICFECKNGFVESISVSSHAHEASDEETPAFGNEFLQVLRQIAQEALEDDAPHPPPPSDHPAVDNDYLQLLRLISQAARDDDAPPPPPPSDHPAGDSDYLRVELDGWEDEQEQYQVRARFNDNDEDEQEEEEIDNQNEEEEDEFGRRERLRIQLRDFASRAASRRNQILDWAEILMGLEDHYDDAYVSNPGDYVNAAGYEALLQTLAESDSTTERRGAPPAAKSAVENLHTVEVKSSDMETCAICKDRVYNNEDKTVKKLECGHMYHGECIVAWLDSRNTCPVCRYELPTDDPEYEEDRKKRLNIMNGAKTDHGCSSSSG